eukprot:124246-Pyramimonas_sp.AAC.1
MNHSSRSRLSALPVRSQSPSPGPGRGSPFAQLPGKMLGLGGHKDQRPARGGRGAAAICAR